MCLRVQPLATMTMQASIDVLKEYRRGHTYTERESRNQWMESKNYHFCVLFIASRSQTMNKHIRFDHKFLNKTMLKSDSKTNGLTNIAPDLYLYVCANCARQCE